MKSIKKLIKKFEKPHGYYVLTSYFSMKFIDDYFLDFLRLIDKDKRLKKESVTGPKSVISLALRKFIKSYVKKQRQKIYGEDNSTIESKKEVSE